MSTLTDLLAKTVASAAQGVEIPSNVQSTVLNGLSDSVLKSLNIIIVSKVICYYLKYLI